MTTDLNYTIELGDFVINPRAPEWGTGKVQSKIDGKITVNFEHMGKVVIDGTLIELEQKDI